MMVWSEDKSETWRDQMTRWLETKQRDLRKVESEIAALSARKRGLESDITWIKQELGP